MTWLKISLWLCCTSLCPALPARPIPSWDFPVSAGGDSSSHSWQTKPGGLGRPCLGKALSWKLIFGPNPGKSKGWSGGGLRFPQSMATEEVTQHQPWTWKPSSSSSSSPPGAGITVLLPAQSCCGSWWSPSPLPGHWEVSLEPSAAIQHLQRCFSGSATGRAGEQLPGRWWSWKLC